jgi:hypothetical protein
VRVERWRALGRFLPRDVRERIFEPAFGDLTYQWLSSEGARRLPFGVRALGTFLGCFSVLIPRLFVKGGRLTGFGPASVWTVAVLATVMLVLANFAQSYASYNP